MSGRQLPSNHRGVMLSSCKVHPCPSVGSGGSKTAVPARLQMAIWKLALNMCCSNARRHGGKLLRSIFLLRFIEPSCNPHFSLMIVYRRALTSVNWRRPYMAQVNSSSPVRRFGVTCHSPPRAHRTLWNLGYVFNILMGFSFPMPLNALVESQWVKICRAVIAVQYSGVRSFTSSVMLISRLLLPVPVSNSTVQDRVAVWCKRTKNTSLSGLRIRTYWYPCSSAYLQYKIILESVSSWNMRYSTTWERYLAISRKFAKNCLAWWARHLMSYSVRTCIFQTLWRLWKGGGEVAGRSWSSRDNSPNDL